MTLAIGGGHFARYAVYLVDPATQKIVWQRPPQGAEPEMVSGVEQFQLGDGVASDLLTKGMSVFLHIFNAFHGSADVDWAVNIGLSESPTSQYYWEHKDKGDWDGADASEKRVVIPLPILAVFRGDG